MANIVQNRITVLVSPDRLDTVVAELRNLFTNMEKQGSDTEAIEAALWGKGRCPEDLWRATLVSAGGTELNLESAWGPATAIPSRLVTLLSKLDPKVLVVSRVEEEFYQIVGVELSFWSKGQVRNVEAAGDLSELVADIEEKHAHEDDFARGRELIGDEVDRFMDRCLVKVFTEARKRYGRRSIHQVGLGLFGECLRLERFREMPGRMYLA